VVGVLVVRGGKQSGKRNAVSRYPAPHLRGDDRDHFIRRHRFFSRDDEDIPDRTRMFRRKGKNVDQVVDVDQVMQVLPVADHDENALPDRLEQFQQPAIPRTVRFGNPKDDDGQSILEGKHDVFSLKLRFSIDIVRIEG